ncbi:hypothetical protein T03_9440 [Trichinella britovi]|uniref:Uncharacterized protein n=1 Tax=Trichinella britovi TaxID=45882 RepID=A0A0V1C435_TRIBR|nr:hypothetical protein T03_9440 [Trichinella britovi]
MMEDKGSSCLTPLRITIDQLIPGQRYFSSGLVESVSGAPSRRPWQSRALLCKFLLT